MVFYFVQRGETLYAIAKRYQTTVHAIVAANRLDDPNGICAGQALIIPRPGEVPTPPPGGIVHLVRPGETIMQLAQRFGTTVVEILRVNQIAHPEFVLPGQQLVIPEPCEAGEEWPTCGRTGARCSASPAPLIGRPVAGWQFRPRTAGGCLPSAPVIRYDRVYAGLSDGVFYCLDRGSGRVKWRFPTEQPPASWPMAAPLVFDGLAYLATPTGAVHALDAYKGTRVWRVDLGAAASATPAQAGGLLYIASGDGRFHALETKTGAVAWRRSLGAPVEVAPAVGDGMVFVLDAAGQLQALDGQSGELVWRRSVERRCQVAGSDATVEPACRPPEVDATPVAAQPVEADTISGGPPVAETAAGDGPGTAPTGTPMEPATVAEAAPSTKASGMGTPAVHPVFAELLLLVGGEALDPRSGETQWEIGEWASPAVRGEDLFYPGGAVDLYTGRYRWRWAEEADWVPGSRWPLVAAGHLLVGCRDNEVRAWRAEDGVAAWSHAIDSPALHQPALAAGMIVLCLTDGSLRTLRMKLDRQKLAARHA